jgi:hypothetical protein
VTTLTRLRKHLPIALGLTAALALTSCSQTDSPPPPGPPAVPFTSPSSAPSTATTTAPSTARATPSGKRIAITVKGKRITPTPGTVNLAVGESLTITVTSDHDDQLHAHGFEVEKTIKAGQPMEFTVKGAQTGVFEVELHHPELRIMQVAVR